MILSVRNTIDARSGFTLVETLLALTLSAFLLMGVYAAVDQSIRMTASGREEMERAQLARALIHRIEVDLRSVTFTTPPVEDTDSTTTTSSSSTSSTSSSTSQQQNSGGNSNSGSSSSGGSSTTSSSTTTMSSDTETEPNSRSYGIRGTTQRMEMSVTRPRRDLLPGSSQVSGLSGTSDLRSVTYSFISSGLAIPVVTNTTSSLSSAVNAGGFVRSEGDRMAVEAVEATGAASTTISVSQTLAPEVSQINFRYFDGRTWLDIWDSETSGRIPRAVEVMIAFTPPKKKPSLFNVVVSHSLETFRTVIMIPISDPFPPEFLP